EFMVNYQHWQSNRFKLLFRDCAILFLSDARSQYNTAHFLLADDSGYGSSGNGSHACPYDPDRHSRILFQEGHDSPQVFNMFRTDPERPVKVVFIRRLTNY